MISPVSSAPMGPFAATPGVFADSLSLAQSSPLVRNAVPSSVTGIDMYSTYSPVRATSGGYVDSDPQSFQILNGSVRTRISQGQTYISGLTLVNGWSPPTMPQGFPAEVNRLSLIFTFEPSGEGRVLFTWSGPSGNVASRDVSLRYFEQNYPGFTGINELAGLVPIDDDQPPLSQPQVTPNRQGGLDVVGTDRAEGSDTAPNRAAPLPFTESSDFILGMGGNDVLRGGGGNDTINGGRGRDEIYGGTGADILDGDRGNDVVYAGRGNDTIYALRNGGSNETDYVIGGGGSDTVIFTGRVWEYNISYNASNGVFSIFDRFTNSTIYVSETEYFRFNRQTLTVSQMIAIAQG